MSYCDSDDVRLVCGVAENVISSGDIGGLIVYSDQEIDDIIGSSFRESVPNARYPSLNKEFNGSDCF